MNFKNRKNPILVKNIGNAIVDLLRVIPEGVLLFFTSYDMMFHYNRVWKDNDIMKRISESKKVYIEKKNSREE